MKMALIVAPLMSEAGTVIVASLFSAAGPFEDESVTYAADEPMPKAERFGVPAGAVLLVVAVSVNAVLAAPDAMLSVGVMPLAVPSCCAVALDGDTVNVIEPDVWAGDGVALSVRVGGAVTLLAHAVRTAPSKAIRRKSRFIATAVSDTSARVRQTTA
jgi:hypothetical protein